MIDILILFATLVFGYSYFRSYGGKGLNIKTEFAPASTPQGKRERKSAWAVLGLMTASLVFVVVHNQVGVSWVTVVVPIILGLPFILAPYFRNRK